MNMEQPRLAGPVEVMERARTEAERLGVALGDSELVGLVPRAALAPDGPAALGLRSFRPGQLVEAHLPPLQR
jgi:glutamate formiminotransferase